MDDSELMYRTAAGDQRAFRELVERYQRPIYNFFFRSTASREDAEDLTQKLFLNLYKSSGRYRKRSSFKTYIYKIASNLAISFARKNKNRTVIPFDQEEESGNISEELPYGRDPVLDIQASELEGSLKAALVKLPPDLSSAIDLRVRKGFAYREIAEIMGKSISAVESMIFRARKILLVELKEVLDQRDS
ncbi:MAG TPA: sigma-70 family RNA polymerase sigma factor [Candidatus Krumholzibacteriaceae bacterium]|nr:sigma-70 family RNA polymerase sigma factor [Candidatus Krumholzibacteriaceae bacterium]